MPHNKPVSKNDNAALAMLAALKGPSAYLQRLSERGELPGRLSEHFSTQEQITIVKALLDLNQDILKSVAADEGVRKEIASDLQFLISAALREENCKAFFSAGDVREAALSFTSIRNALASDLQFLIDAVLKPDASKAFFGDARVREAAVSFTSIRNAVTSKLPLLVDAALKPDMQKPFFSDARVREAAASFTSIRDAVAANVDYLTSKDEIRNAIFDTRPSEAEAVKVLSAHWPHKRRQLHGFELYYNMLEKLKAYYGDSQQMKRLAAAAPPAGGFPSDIELRDFLCAHLCKDGLFHMRDAALKYVDSHAIWTLINEILVDEEYYFETDVGAPFIIDGGANFGMSTIYFKQLYPNAKVIAFEPVPYLHGLAEENVRRNRYADIDVVKKALSANKGTAAFYLSKQYSMAGSLTDRRRAFNDELEELTVETVALGDYIDRDVDFLKLDIEGGEGEVLLGLGDKIRNIKQMCVEWHLRPGTPSARLDEVLSLLGRNGFDYQIGKSANYAKKSKTRPMTFVRDLGTLNFWAARR